MVAETFTTDISVMDGKTDTFGNSTSIMETSFPPEGIMYNIIKPFVDLCIFSSPLGMTQHPFVLLLCSLHA